MPSSGTGSPRTVPLEDSLGLPRWALTLVVAFTLLGISVALVLTRALEVTSEEARRMPQPLKIP